jgi:hypothetical protein
MAFSCLGQYAECTFGAHVTQEGWDALTALPALRKLYMLRIKYSGFDALDFNGLSKLQEFQTGTLLCREAFALGAAVRNSNLEKLHIRVARLGMAVEQRDTLKNFFAGFTTLDYGGSLLSASSMEECSGFPSSLVDLSIAKEYDR